MKPAVAISSFLALVALIGCQLPLMPPVTYSAWSSSQNVGTTVNSSSNDQHPALAPDGLSLYFASDRPGNVSGSLAKTLDIWVAHRSAPGSPWETPENLGKSINSIYTEFAPNLSFDGHWLYFSSERLGGCGMRDIYASYRTDLTTDSGTGGWQTPVNMGCALNSAEYDDGPSYFKDPFTGLVTMYLTTQNRPDGLGDFDIWQSIQQSDGTWGAATNVAELNSTSRDTRTAIRHDGLEMYLTSMRSGSVVDSTKAPSLDIWVSTRPNTFAPWGAPTDVPGDINGAYSDGAPAISADGTEMYFYSNRPGGSGLNDLYVVTRTKTSQ
jgi:WD40-like Beta Propeller Repeat